MSIERPCVEGAPGLVWRQRKKGWVAEWKCRSDLCRRGFPRKSHWLCNVQGELTEGVRKYIVDRCNAFQTDMLIWARGGIPQPAAYDGTIRSLILSYQSDPDSRYQKVRYHTRVNYDSLCARIERDHGDVLVADIKAKHILRWHEDWTKIGAPLAHSLVGMLRSIVSFGTTILECDQCARIQVVLHHLRFPMVEARKEHITADMANAIRAKAHEMGFPSIALAQAFQFECTLRQKDVIGEWVPQDEPVPGELDPDTGNKWLRGITWQEIDASLVLRHRTSKRSKELQVNLRLAPMVIEELRRLAGLGPEAELTRAHLPAGGPVILSDLERRKWLPRRPWYVHNFRHRWRQVARACRIPDHVYNMDSRAGAITEATDSGALLEDVRHAATHSNIAMTQRYSRGSAQKVENVMVSRVNFRTKERG